CAELGSTCVRDRNRLGHRAWRLATDQNPWLKILQNSPGPWLLIADHLRDCHHHCLSAWKPCQHNPGGEFFHHGCWGCRTHEQSALGGGWRDHGCLGHYHPGHHACWRAVLLALSERAACGFGAFLIEKPSVRPVTPNMSRMLAF